MITEKIIHDAGTTFRALNPSDNDIVSVLYVLPNNRILKSQGGTFISDDNGNTWVQKSTSNFQSLCVTPTGRIIGTTNGLKYSDDNGETWHTVPDMSGYFNTLCVTPTGRILVSKYSTSDGFWYSDDNGEHWTHVSSAEFAVRWLLSISPSELIGGGSSSGIYKSEDNGLTWTKIYDAGAMCSSTDAVCVLPTGRIIICSDGVGIKYSDDNGITWTAWSASNVMSYEINCICRTTSGRLIAGAYRGIWKSDDNGETWVKVQSDDDKCWLAICVTETGRVLVGTGSGQGYSPNGVWYSDPEYADQYGSRPITKKEAQILVQQCKAYVQSLKNGN